jgi:hypothetical protein
MGGVTIGDVEVGLGLLNGGLGDLCDVCALMVDNDGVGRLSTMAGSAQANHHKCDEKSDP